MPSFDVWLYGMAAFGATLGAFHRPWWSAALVSAAILSVMILMEFSTDVPATKLATVVSPQTLFIGFGMLVLPALIGWVAGNLLYLLLGWLRRSRP